MGMRAAVIYRMKSGKVKVSTLQWSTMLDKTFIADIESAVKNNHASSKINATRDFFRNATTISGHYSAIEHMTGQEANNERRKKNGQSTKVRKIGPLSYGVFYDGNVSADVYEDVTYTDIRRMCREVLDGGSVGIYFDEAQPTTVKFFRLDNDTYDLCFEDYPLV